MENIKSVKANMINISLKDGLPYLFHSFRNILIKFR